jgi:hypothetical protein
VVRSQSAQLQVITRRTEPFSPSRQSRIRRHLFNLPTTPELTMPSSVSTSSPACLCGHACSLPKLPNSSSPPTLAQAPSASPGSNTSSQPSFSRALSPPHSSPSADAQVHAPVLGLQPTDLSPLVEHQTVHLPILVTHTGGTFYVLPLSPPPLRTPFDLILPPPIAFCAPGGSSSAQYPAFDTGHCSWHAIFKLILQPDMLWDTWGPRSLGAYPDVKSLWETWDEGASVDGVGRGPPLRLVESEWGRHEDKRTGKGKLPAWRPRKNKTVRDIV